jgi:hypothetical protein
VKHREYVELLNKTDKDSWSYYRLKSVEEDLWRDVVIEQTEEWRKVPITHTVWPILYN